MCIDLTKEMIDLNNNRIQIIDDGILNFCSMKLKNKYFDRAMPVITHSDDYGMIYVALILLSAIFDYRIDIAVKLMLALALGSILGEGLLKHLVVRNRPIAKNPCYKLLVRLPKTTSFPSGHTTSAFAVFAVFWGLSSTLAYLFLVIALLIAFSRLYLYLHYPSDIFVGMLLGLICGKLAFAMYGNIYLAHLLSQFVSFIGYII